MGLTFSENDAVIPNVKEVQGEAVLTLGGPVDALVPGVVLAGAPVLGAAARARPLLGALPPEAAALLLFLVLVLGGGGPQAEA